MPSSPVQMVYLDFEATGLSRDADIVQIAASAPSWQSPTSTSTDFSTYISTDKEFTESAKQVTGMNSVDGILVKNGLPVGNVKNREEAFAAFHKYLTSFGKKIIFVGYGLSRFDMPLFQANLKRLGMWSIFDDIFLGYVDLFGLVKAHRYFGSLKLMNVLKKLAPEKFHTIQFHDAWGDVEATKIVAQKIGVTEKQLTDRATKYMCFPNDILSQ